MANIDAATLIPALALSILGGFLTLWLLLLIFRPIVSRLQELRHLSGLKKAAYRIATVDSYLEQKRFLDAIDELSRALFLSPPLSSKVLDAFRDHHQNVLSRYVLVADELDVHIQNIERLEHLLFERGELLQLRIQAEEAFHRLISRRKERGKEVPSWSRGDYKVKIQEISTELEANKKMLTREFDALVSALKKNPSSEVLYH